MPRDRAVVPDRGSWRERPGGRTPSLVGVFGLLLVLFVAVPAAERYVILPAARGFGGFETVAAPGALPVRP